MKRNGTFDIQGLEQRLLWATYWVDLGTGVDGAGAAGSVDQPFKSITYAVSQAKQPGDMVNVNSGTYRGEAIRFAASGTAAQPITLQASPGANVTIKGSQLVTGWTQVAGTNVWKTPWQYFFAKQDATQTDARAQARNQFFVDGVPMREMTTLASVTAGSFYIDSAAKQVYLQPADNSDPNAHGVEGSNTESALLRTESFDHLVIRGLNFLQAANKAQSAALVQVNGTSVNGVTTDPSDDVLIDGLNVQYAAGAGLSAYDSTHFVMRNTTLSNNGELGFNSTRVVNGLVSGGTLSNNNKLPGKTFSTSFEAGGAKISRSQGFVVDGVTANGNTGAGIWFDLANKSATIRNNRAYDNAGIGIFYEISYTASIYNNLSYNNTTSGIAVISSAGNEIYHNVTYGNPGGRNPGGVGRERRAGDARRRGGELRQRVRQPRPEQHPVR